MKIIALFLAAVTVWLAPQSTTNDLVAFKPQAVPVKTGPETLNFTPEVSAYAIDTATTQALYAQNADRQRPIASITKLITALVVLHDSKTSQIVTIPQLPAYAPADELAGLQPGQRFSIHDLLVAMLVHSGDDAADALAITNSGNAPSFVAKMNDLMRQWGVGEAHFSNPSGLVDENNQASARALGRIALLALQNHELQQVVGLSQASVTDQSGKSLSLTSTDSLLQNGRFQGIKTGYTPAAGQCFVGLTSIKGHRVITVVLGSGDRFGDTAKLADWIQRNYTWQ